MQIINSINVTRLAFRSPSFECIIQFKQSAPIMSLQLSAARTVIRHKALTLRAYQTDAHQAQRTDKMRRVFAMETFTFQHFAILLLRDDAGWQQPPRPPVGFGQQFANCQSFAFSRRLWTRGMESGAIFWDIPLGLDSVEIIALSFFLGPMYQFHFWKHFSYLELRNWW